MKIIIIEGTDRTGKDTLINELKNYFDRTLIIHCGKPIGSTNNEKILFQNKFFNDHINKLTSNIYENICDAVIFNRSWLGEYVYGQLYRNMSIEQAKEFISNKDLLLNNNSNLDIYYIQLVNSSNKLIHDYDDGNSLSNESSMINKERELFYDVYSLTSIKNKKIVNVNVKDQFRDKTDILNEVLEFINVNV